MPLDEQPDFMLLWEQFNDPLPHQSGKIMVCGHTPQYSGRPKHLGHAVCIDTWAHGQGWLTCLDVATGRYWQANEMGERRSSFLE
jgi:serine/threonine protein phosphatase 1